MSCTKYPDEYTQKREAMRNWMEPERNGHSGTITSLQKRTEKGKRKRKEKEVSAANDDDAANCSSFKTYWSYTNIVWKNSSIYIWQKPGGGQGRKA